MYRFPRKARQLEKLNSPKFNFPIDTTNKKIFLIPTREKDFTQKF